MNIVEISEKERHIKIFEAQNATKLLIAIHGFTSSLESPLITMLGETLTEQGCSVLTFDLPRHGTQKSDKPIDLNECFEMIEYIENFAKEKYNLPISYFATSFGGYLILKHLEKSKKEYQKIFLRAPAVFMGDMVEGFIKSECGISPEDLGQKSIDMGNVHIDKKFVKDLKENNLSNFKSVNYLHIFQGKKDKVVSFSDNEQFFKTHAKDKHKIYYFENADHRFKKPGEFEKIVEITKSILF